MADNSQTTSIFLLINFANIYLLFSDYSSNTILLKDTLQSGGVRKGNISEQLITDIASYIGVKAIVLFIGFFVWVALCLIVPQLKVHKLSNILAYTFIIGYNINFYWLYMTSDKEYFFIISNFFGRLFFLFLLVLFIFFKLNFFLLMPLVGVGSIAISILSFLRFCSVYSFKVNISIDTFKHAAFVVRRDWPLVANSFLIMTPTTCLSFFIGFIKNSSAVLVYAFAEKIFMAIRALLGVFVNSVYPVICQQGSIFTKRSKQILMAFYLAVVLGCIVTYLLSPIIFSYLHQPVEFNKLFTKCVEYFLLTTLAIGLNTPYFLQLLVTNHFNDKKNFILFKRVVVHFLTYSD